MAPLNKKGPASTQGKKSSSGGGAEEQQNRPRNFYVTDASHPFTYAFQGRFGVRHQLTVQQTPDDDTWPGGALWDLGILLSHVLLGLAGVTTASTTNTNTATTTGGKSKQERGQQKSHGATLSFKTKHHTIKLPPRLVNTASTETKDGWIPASLLSEGSSAIILELGCGVGLTALVAAAVLRPALVVLTDLQVVVDKVTRPNCHQNTVAATKVQPCGFRYLGQTACTAETLCWGNAEDEDRLSQRIQDFQQHKSTTRKTKKNHKAAKEPMPENHAAKADLVLIGDVAYQHKPGAPSHFEALHSTLLRFLHPDTIVVFGTRIRMPASNDLLQLLLQDLEELVNPPLAANDIEPSFAQWKHNMTIHFMRKKRR